MRKILGVIGAISLLITFSGCDLFNFEKPGTPVLLYAVQTDDNHVTVMWRNSENADSYTVFWSEEETPDIVIGFSSKFSALEGVNRTVTIGNSGFSGSDILYFRVYAENGNGTSAASLPKKVSFSVPKSWTIMVWLDGDNSLDAEAKEDFHEMEAGLYAAMQADPDIQDYLNIIVQYDGRDDGNFGRYVVQPLEKELETDTPYYGKISGGLSSEPNMGSAAQLQAFIQYTKLFYPAENYALILWNHGGGVRSLQESGNSREISEDITDNDFLYIGEIKDQLIASDSVDFLGMDACLMGMTEIAYEFRYSTEEFGAKAMAFSPAEEQGDGWEYQNIINRFRGSSYSDGTSKAYYDIESLPANDFARIVVEEYEDTFSDQPAETQTAVDLTKIASVKTKIDQLATLLVNNKYEVEILRGYANDSISDSTIEPTLMHYFDASSGYDWENYANFDLYDLALRIRESSAFNLETQNQADELMVAVEEAIIYSWAGSRYNGDEIADWKNGLGIFFPDGDADDAYRTDDTYTYWTYQYFYSSLPHSDIENWAGNTNLNYGAIDFCTGDGNGIVEGWFELLQKWYNPTGHKVNSSIHPGPMW